MAIVQGLSKYGSTVPSGINPASQDMLLTIITAPTAGKTTLTFLNVASLQFGGAFKNPSYAPIYIFRGGKGQAVPYGDSTSLVGLPSASWYSTSASLELVYSAYFNLQSQAGGFTLPNGGIEALPSQSLYIACTGLVDGSVAPPVLMAGVVALTVLGRDENPSVNVKLR